jgi:hypothetical protein
MDNAKQRRLSAPDKRVALGPLLHTTVVHDELLAGAALAVTDCVESTIYILSPVGSASVSRCRNCLIVVGACEGVLHLQHCQNVTLVAASSVLQVSDCHHCELNIFCASPPLLTDNSSHLSLGPFNTAYPAFHRHLCSLAAFNPADHASLWRFPVLGPCQAHHGKQQTQTTRARAVSNTIFFFLLFFPFLPWVGLTTLFGATARERFLLRRAGRLFLFLGSSPSACGGV